MEPKKTDKRAREFIFQIWGVFRTQANIYDGAFLWKYLTTKSTFFEKAAL